MHLNRARRLVLGITSLGFLLSAGDSLRADLVTNVSTGLDASNNVLTSGGLSDAHWSVPEQVGGIGAAQSVFPNNADWFGGWVANNSSSDWIARNANITNNGPAPYTFSTTFNLSGYNLSTVSLVGSWAIDDTGTLNLNGQQLGSLTNGWTNLTSFSVAAGSNLFAQGVNTLSITITSTDDYLEGVRLQGSVTATPFATAPEPATIINASIGAATLLAFGWVRRHRRKPR